MERLDVKCKMNVFKYNLNRERKSYGFMALLPLIIMFALILLASAIQNSFESEYLRKLVEGYPTDAFNIQKNQLDAFEYKDKIETYDYYYGEENGVSALYIAYEMDSVFSIDGVLQEGGFPKADNEIVVSEGYIVNVLDGTDEELVKYIGEKVTFKDKEFSISGITYGIEPTRENYIESDTFYTYFRTDAYYHSATDNTIFIPYDTIKDMYEPQEFYLGEGNEKTILVRAYYRNLFSDDMMRSQLKKCFIDGKINVFEKELASSKNTINNISKTLLLVFGACFICACIYMRTQIQIELHYRRKEFGYLQIFGLSKARIMRLILSGYLLKILVALIYAIPMYLIIIVLYYLMFGNFILFNYTHVIAIICFILVFYMITVLIAILKFLRRSVIGLIN